VDPLWEEMPGFSPFHYCFNNPIMMRDPFGLEPDGQSTKRGSVFSKKTDDDAPDAGITDEVVCEAEGPWSHWWSFMEGSRKGNEWMAGTGAARMGEPTAADKLDMERRRDAARNLALEATSKTLNAFGFASGIKETIIEGGAAISRGIKLSRVNNISILRTYGSYGAKYLRYSKRIGIAGSIITTGYSALKVYDQYATGGGLKNVFSHRDILDVGVGLAGIGAFFLMSNPVGWGIGAGVMVYGAATMFYDAYHENK
jgi:hypothetical protein